MTHKLRAIFSQKSPLPAFLACRPKMGLVKISTMLGNRVFSQWGWKISHVWDDLTEINEIPWDSEFNESLQMALIVE